MTVPTDFTSWAGGYEFVPANYSGMQSAKAVTGATQANPGQITAVGHGYSNNDIVYHDSVVGMTELNGNSYTVTVVDADNYTIGVDTTLFSAYTSGGTAQKTDADGTFSNLLSGQPLITMGSGLAPVFQKNHGVVGWLFDGATNGTFNFRWNGEMTVMGSGHKNWTGPNDMYFFAGSNTGANTQYLRYRGGSGCQFFQSLGSSGFASGPGVAEAFVASGGVSPENGSRYVKYNGDAVVSAAEANPVDFHDAHLIDLACQVGKHRTTFSFSGSWQHRLLFFNRCEFERNLTQFESLQTDEMAILGL